MPTEESKEVRTCNRHHNCDEAEKIWLAAHPGERWVPASFHCHDECCEECFGN
jgi:hypothetical protein